jgi:peptidoglycan/LPS O-acetylase OafA/YrhL
MSDSRQEPARWSWRGVPLERCIVQGRDNFLLLRLLAAALVIFGHSWATADNPAHATDWIGQHTLVFSGTVAVDIFFWVSGFLVTMSYARRPQPLVFVASRVLRIFPALIVCVLLCALVLGPAVSTLSAAEYFRDPDTLAFVRGNIMLDDLRWTLPGVFAANHAAGIVNGCLWTLPGEVRMYEIVVCAGILGLLRGPLQFVLALAILCAMPRYAPSVPLIDQPEYYEFAAYFALGAASWFARGAIRVSGLLLLGLCAVALALRGHDAYRWAFGACVAYGAMWFAYAPRLPSLERIGDYSYGLYLYGYPVQQLVAMWQPQWGPWQSLAASLPLTLLLAIASWHAIEKPALRLKPRGKRSREAAAALAPARAG